MASEYVLTISRRDVEHPLSSTVLIEAGINTAKPKAFVEAFASITELLRMFGTPEKVADFMQKNAALGLAKTIKKDR